MTFSDFTHSEAAGKDHYLLFGHPVAHSLSPVIHQRALDECGLQAVYAAVNLQPDEISAAIAWMHHHKHFKGANVTLPYKQTFMDAVDEAGEEVRATGALNTIKRLLPESKSGLGTLKAINTDIQGFLTPLEPYMEDALEAPALIFGTGGAARAALYALTVAGFQEVCLISRDARRAESAFARELQESSVHLTFLGVEEWHTCAEESYLMVNATPAGMLHFPESSPVPVNELTSLLRRSGPKLLYDLVYTPYETPYLIAGHETNCIILHGLEMFLHQAAASFRFWTGCDFPVDACRAIVKEKLHVRS